MIMHEILPLTLASRRMHPDPEDAACDSTKATAHQSWKGMPVEGAPAVPGLPDGPWGPIAITPGHPS